MRLALFGMVLDSAFHKIRRTQFTQCYTHRCKLFVGCFDFCKKSNLKIRKEFSTKRSMSTKGQREQFDEAVSCVTNRWPQLHNQS